MLVVGKGGVGKSSTVNSIVGERVTVVSAFQVLYLVELVEPNLLIQVARKILQYVILTNLMILLMIQSETLRPLQCARSRAGFTLNIIDTPGLVEGGCINDQALDIIKRYSLLLRLLCLRNSSITFDHTFTSTFIIQVYFARGAKLGQVS